MQILLWFSPIILSSLITWLISSYYYNRSKKDYELAITKNIEANIDLTNEIKKYNDKDKLAIKEDRISKAVEDYLRKGTPKYIIDTFTELSQEEKAEMYDLVLLRAKGRKGGNNPYK